VIPRQYSRVSSVICSYMEKCYCTAKLSFNKKDMADHKSKDPLHGITLEMILIYLVEQYGWGKMGQAVDIRCFSNDPSVKSSLQFLRRTPWARKKVEDLYLRCRRDALNKEKRDQQAL
jgi:uncharacterized protein (DUF2132 family)